MAEIYPLKEIPRSDGGCSIVEIDNDDYFAVEALPVELPNDWNKFLLDIISLRTIKHGI